MQEGGCTEIRTGHDEGGDLRARRRRSTDEDCDFLSSCRSQKVIDKYVDDDKSLINNVKYVCQMYILHFILPRYFKHSNDKSWKIASNKDDNNRGTNPQKNGFTMPKK